MSASSSPEPADNEIANASPLDVTESESAMPLEDADCTMPGAFVVTPLHSSPSKRQRSPSPDIGREATVPVVIAVSTPSCSPRKLAGLPRKSLAPATFAYIPPVPVSDIETSTCSSGLYPALPSTGTQVDNNEEGCPSAMNHDEAKFTFTCPLGDALVSSTSSLPASASVLQQLNARLAASGVPPATLTSASTRPMLSHSPSASSLIRSKSSNELAASKGAQRFERAHQKQWSKTGSIAEHWSLGRKGGKSRSISATHSPEQEGSRKKKVKVEDGQENRSSTGPSKGAVSKGLQAERQAVGSAGMIGGRSKAVNAQASSSAAAATAPSGHSKTASARRPLPALAVRKPRSSLGSALISKGTIRTPYIAKLYEKSRSRQACGPRIAQQAQPGETPRAIEAKALHNNVSAARPTDGKENAVSGISVDGALSKSNGVPRSAHSLSSKSSLAPSSSATAPTASTSSRASGTSSYHPYARPAQLQSQARRPIAPSTPATLNALRVLETKRRAAEESRRKIVEARATAAAGKGVPVNALAAK